MIAPPRSRCRSEVPDAMPARDTGTEPVSDRDAGVPANPTPMPTNAYARATHQKVASSSHHTSATTSPRTTNR